MPTEERGIPFAVRRKGIKIYKEELANESNMPANKARRKGEFFRKEKILLVSCAIGCLAAFPTKKTEMQNVARAISPYPPASIVGFIKTISQVVRAETPILPKSPNASTLPIPSLLFLAEEYCAAREFANGS